MQEPMGVPPDLGMEAQERVAQLMQEAVRLFDQNRLEEALLACEGILALAPRHTRALSLKGLIHEHRGQIAEAIRAYEQVLEIDPLSVAERARLDALRQGRKHTRPALRPIWVDAMPAILAFLGAGLVLLMGFAWLIRTSTPAPQSPPPTTSPTQAVAPPPAFPPNPTPPSPQRPTQEEGAVPPVLVDPDRIALTPTNPPTPPLTGALPNKSPSQNTPKEANPAEPPKPNNTPKAQPQGEVMPDVKVELRDPGVYEIQVHRSGQNEGNSPHENLLAIAQSHQMAGNYRDAITAYQRALPNAPSPGYVHQQIATCYLRLGDKASARTHFLQAIQEYERQIQAGREVESAQQGLAACQDGLKLCEE